jgi:predicted nucleic acid-binding protein
VADQAEIHRMARSENAIERREAVEQLRSNFASLPDKKQAWEDLIRLTRDYSGDIRAEANYSLGRASIFKATESEGDDDLRRELENALEYFECSVKEARYFNPAKFCLPFYRSFYAVTFKKQEAEAEVQKYLSEAKSAVAGSKSILKTILSEGRKFGIGICMVSQRPSKLDADSLSQCMTQITMRIINSDKFVFDTNILISRMFSDLSNSDFFERKTLLIPETVVDEINHWKNYEEKRTINTFGQY